MRLGALFVFSILLISCGHKGKVFRHCSTYPARDAKGNFTGEYLHFCEDEVDGMAN